MIAIMDLDLGNLYSVRRAIEYAGGQSIVTDDVEIIGRADKLILPGVGSFKSGMEGLHSKGILKIIRARASRGVPVLGICLGMQLLMDHSEEEGSTVGLGLIPGEVKNLANMAGFNSSAKVPHMNWCPIRKDVFEGDWGDTILHDISEGEECYFVHSFCAIPRAAEHTIAVTEYGGVKFASVIKRDNITGCQFHPEKSGGVGLRIVEGFLRSGKVEL